jgi:hypothetical protein
MSSRSSIQKENGGEGGQRVGESNSLSLARTFLVEICIGAMGNSGCKGTREGDCGGPVVPRHGRAGVELAARTSAAIMLHEVRGWLVEAGRGRRRQGVGGGQAPNW